MSSETAAAWDLFADVRDITAWLDRSRPPGPHEDSMHVLKLVEEAGEAAAAYIGMMGQNPRKGVTHTRMDLLNELADVALTALCAMQHFTQDAAVTRGVLASKVAGISCAFAVRAAQKSCACRSERPAMIRVRRGSSASSRARRPPNVP